jgi:hypothetical protein
VDIVEQRLAVGTTQLLELGQRIRALLELECKLGDSSCSTVCLRASGLELLVFSLIKT